MLRQASFRHAAHALRRASPQFRGFTSPSRRPFHLNISPEVKDALRVGKPLVALESTIISHGMPFPQNYEMATEVEEIVRKNGACPATIAILNGEICVGLSPSQLHTLATCGPDATKCSTRDIAAVVARKGTGATTVSSTMRIAHAAGIQVFVTGGIGGVHRFCEETMDISTDLMELSRTPVAVVCAGVKSILDIPRTLEYLETHAVPVVGFKTKEFPAFFTQTSGSAAHLQLDSAADCATLIHTSAQLQLPNGFIVAVPNPNPVDASVIDTAIHDGLVECKAKGISGNAVTPYLLKRVNELTKGASLASNIALVKNNAVVGAQIACALHETQRRAVRASPPPQVAVVGGAVLDVVSKPTDNFLRGTSNLGRTKQSWGGVGRNVAECLRRLDVETMMVSSVGADAGGAGLVRHLEDLGMDVSGLAVVDGEATATYCAMLTPCGDLDVAIADMDIFDTISWTDDVEDKLRHAHAIVFDGNLSPETMARLVHLPADRQFVWFEPTSVEKATRPIQAKCLHRVHVVSPNRDELRSMSEALADDYVPSVHALAATLKDVVASPEQLLRDVVTVFHAMRGDNRSKEAHVVVTLGRDGALVGTTHDVQKHIGAPETVVVGSIDGISVVYLPCSPLPLANCTGAGDSFVGGTVYGLLQGHDIVQSSKLGMVAARKSISSEFAIHPALRKEDLA
ncbi:Aste57867_14884 [Aphanomyces stellatus]|uniref:Aste57867_14884 protein n=1 Tax=Aphanomyces stellatus TaxID=120398 RepID=A0A485L2D8_9STRA|nr:hypothetical protein As57867_014828 [Aphanomyces stellatus]VFT91701.1 Aste57867_14884 [Aphanomyces stellatus]